MQQIHAEGSVRHAEKRRRGTCQFANRIARASLDAYEHSVPQSYRDANKQTCVAAIVAHFHNHTTDASTKKACDNDGDCNDAKDGSNPNLQVMGLGVGTKFLPDAILQEEQQLGKDDADGSYGKRIRDCHAEVLARRAFVRQISMEILNMVQTTDGDKDVKGDVGMKSGYIPILEEVKHEGDTRTSFRLRPGVTLHFYASSAPCK